MVPTITLYSNSKISFSVLKKKTKKAKTKHTFLFSSACVELTKIASLNHEVLSSDDAYSEQARRDGREEPEYQAIRLGKKSGLNTCVILQRDHRPEMITNEILKSSRVVKGIWKIIDRSS